jgi:hypothetical protein
VLAYNFLAATLRKMSFLIVPKLRFFATKSGCGVCPAGNRLA